ncbi:MAG: methyltransferase domain-containing protein [Thermaerobacter sp.]|nr:methyltransferase domain-containing protein [Thermaerobacter sp.]
MASDLDLRAGRLRRSFNLLAPAYDFLFFQTTEEVWEAALSLLQPQEGEKILDVGSGTGRLLIALSQLVGASGSVQGLDISPAMCRSAERQIARTPHPSEIAVIPGDARRLPFADDSFDGAVSVLTLELLQRGQTEAALGELSRVVRRGGRIVVASIADAVTSDRPLQYYELLRRAFPLAYFGRPIALRRLAHAAGLTPRIAMRRAFLRLPVDVLLIGVPQ